VLVVSFVRDQSQGSARRFLFIAAVLLAACGDSSDDEVLGGSGGGQGGTGDGGSTGVAPSTGGQNGAGGNPEEFPVCTLAEAEDHTGAAALTITTNGTHYEPRCARVSAGVEITIESDFEPHPLRGGPIVDGVGMVDPASPVPAVDEGMTVTFPLPDAGEVPYFCVLHSTIGMHGTFYVE
jgi:plastocyanin